MSIETVKLLYNDVDNTRFTAAQYSSFQTSATNALFTLRPDLFASVESVALVQDTAGLAQVSVPAGKFFVKFKGLVKSTDKAMPRLIDYQEAMAKDPTWGYKSGTKLADITEYTIDMFDDNINLYFDCYVPSTTAVIQVYNPATLTYSNTWVDEVLSKYMLYMCYSADSTSQQDQAIAQQYLQEFNTMAAKQRPAVVTERSPFPVKPMPAQQGGQQ